MMEPTDARLEATKDANDHANNLGVGLRIA